MNEHDPLVDRLRALGQQPIDRATRGRHLGAMAAAASAGPRFLKLKVGVAFFGGLLIGGSGLAAAGALPGAVQAAAHSAFSTVGVNVPGGHGTARYNGPECGTDPVTHQAFRNHGQYVRAHKGDPNAATSRCGMPLQAGKGDNGDDSNGNATNGPTSTEAPDNGQGGPPAGRGHGKGQGNGGQGNGQGDDQGNTPSSVANNANPGNGAAPAKSPPPHPTAPPTPTTGASNAVPSTTAIPPTTTTSSASASTTLTTTTSTSAPSH